MSDTPQPAPLIYSRIAKQKAARARWEKHPEGKPLTHGHAGRKTRSGTYSVWAAMKDRCLNAQNPAFKHYGGRGISVCERWNLFENFLADMGECPKGLWLERKNNDGNYEPGNCEWATPTKQLRNSRRARNITFAGRTQCLKAWADEIGIKQNTLHYRIKRWGLGLAITVRPLGKAAHGK